ncbi:MAG TPA: branched-chain amino acid ABC transporter substrate-binding protein [Acidimicrobiales bacterium]|jgi:branched-chain amino acid transport system substrate-binding protein|nr:branched-chain amino acid ABC transporter substrate-binding protein [Acidimicrobiales bacterium]
MKLRLNKTVAAVASSALLLMAVPAVGIASASGAASKAKPTYVIGYEGPLSGGNLQLGLNMVFAVELAINQANASGKNPFKLQLAKYDDQGDPTISPTEAQSAVANKKLIAIVGPAFSGATAAAEPYYSKAHVATVSPSATRVTLATGGWNNFFRVVADDGVQGPADADYLVKTKGNKAVYVVNDGSSYGTGLATAFATEATTDGAKVTTATVPGTAQCTDGTASATEYSAAATQAVASGAKAMFYGGYYCDLGLFLGALGSAGWSGPIMSGDGSDSSALITGTTPASAANGVLLSCACAVSQNSSFNKAFQNLANFSSSNATYAPESYDATNVIIAAMKKLKHITRSAVVAELHKISYKGITKTIKFQKDGNIAGAAIYVNQVTSGKVVQLGLE